MTENAETPYGDAGYGRREEQRDNYRHDLLEGVTSMAQRLTLILAGQQGAHGITIAELRESKGALHHGKMSSALTTLHMTGHLAALKARRGRCGIYVLPEFANGRETRAYKPNRKPINPEVIRGILLHHIADVDPVVCYCGWMPTLQQSSHSLHVAEQIAEALS